MTAELDVRRHDEGCVRVVTLAGAMAWRDSTSVIGAVAEALSSGGRSVVCDARHLEIGSDALVTAFPTALRQAGGWPSSSLRLLVEAGSGVADQMLMGRTARYLPVHTDLEEAFDRAAAERRVDAHRLVLPAEVSSPAHARKAVELMWPASAAGCEEAVLVAGELASNAVRHTERPFTLDLVTTARHSLVAVTDATRGEPVVGEPTPSQPAGRGLRLVAGLCLDWGVRWTYPHGKTVWAAMPRPAVFPQVRRAL